MPAELCLLVVEEYTVNYYFENEKLVIELDGVKNDYTKIFTAICHKKLNSLNF